MKHNSFSENYMPSHSAVWAVHYCWGFSAEDSTWSLPKLLPQYFSLYPETSVRAMCNIYNQDSFRISLSFLWDCWLYCCISISVVTKGVLYINQHVVRLFSFNHLQLLIIKSTFQMSFNSAVVGKIICQAYQCKIIHYKLNSLLSSYSTTCFPVQPSAKISEAEILWSRGHNFK